MTLSPSLQHLLDEFATMAEKSLLAINTAQSAGQKVVGIYCIFAPVEIIRAAGAIPVGLCGKKVEPIAAAEVELPANLCPLIKASYGYAITGTCPFFLAADALVGETTCDGKKKMYEVLGRLKPMHVMHLPHGPDRVQAQHFWRAEIDSFVDFLQDLTGCRITSDALQAQIRIHNRVRRLMRTLHSVNSTPKGVCLSSGALLPLLEAKNYWPDLNDYAIRLEHLIQAITNKSSSTTQVHDGRARILLTGTPLGKGSDKVLRLLEASGAVVVGMENCTDLKSSWTEVDETDLDPLNAIARRYLALPCACMTPNNGRLALIDQLIEGSQVDGVVDLTWHACHTYMIEATTIRRHIENFHQLPILHLSTDYGENDVESLRTRIEAFLEMI
ncbi:MAG: double-cubane-cluster-containing anaerobic reductase [Pseudomonadota bacterium]